MDCPYCGQKMEEGFLLSERRCGWSEQPERYTKWKVQLIPLPWVSYGEKPASMCTKCRKIIIDL